MKGIIKAIVEKKWKDTVFHEFQLEGDERVFSCWAKGWSAKPGEEVEFEPVEKDGRWRANIKSSGGFQPRGKSPDEMKQQVRAFSASYGKDIVVALINQGRITEIKEIDATLLHFYNFFKGLLEA